MFTTCDGRYHRDLKIVYNLLITFVYFIFYVNQQISIIRLDGRVLFILETIKGIHVISSHMLKIFVRSDIIKYVIIVKNTHFR